MSAPVAREVSDLTFADFVRETRPRRDWALMMLAVSGSVAIVAVVVAVLGVFFSWSPWIAVGVFIPGLVGVFGAVLWRLWAVVFAAPS